MTSIGKHLARDVPLRREVRVESVAPGGGGWVVTLEGGEAAQAAAMVLTPPVPQSLVLLESGGFHVRGRESEILRGIEYDPCLAVLALLDEPSGLPEPGGVQVDGEPVAWISDNRMKGISPEASAVTIHAGPEFSRSRWESTGECIAGELLESAGRWVTGTVREVQVKKWRYAKPVRVAREPCLVIEEPGPLVFAGDAFAGPRVEGAALSGIEAARAVAERIESHRS